MKIIGARDYILVQYDHRSVKISGELTTTPAFYADLSSIKNWEPPYENVAITNEEKIQLQVELLKKMKLIV
jgi:hypothetical protein